VLRALWQTARPRQWVKNLFVATPLVFSKHLDDPPQALRALAATLLFCAFSSAVYFLNDLVDVERDRAHPKKRERPIAAGRLSFAAARVAGILLSLGGLLLALELGLDFALYAASYLILNIAYSFVLKRIAYIDVLSIAAGFLLRVLGGAAAIHVWTSPYLIVCTSLGACFFGFGKRAHELSAAGSESAAASQRAALRSYHTRVLDVALLGSGLATLTAYGLYTRAEHTLHFFHTTRMIWTTPFAAFGLLRFRWLVTRREVHDSPTDAMLKDAPFLANLVVWAVAITAIIYYKP
jgi:4-hydroxybenzoate polyprenyltransferase